MPGITQFDEGICAIDVCGSQPDASTLKVGRNMPCADLVAARVEYDA
jgi:hypothetical protein